MIDGLRAQWCRIAALFSSSVVRGVTSLAINTSASLSGCKTTNKTSACTRFARAKFTTRDLLCRIQAAWLVYTDAVGTSVLGEVLALSGWRSVTVYHGNYTLRNYVLAWYMVLPPSLTSLGSASCSGWVHTHQTRALSSVYLSTNRTNVSSISTAWWGEREKKKETSKTTQRQRRGGGSRGKETLARNWTKARRGGTLGSTMLWQCVCANSVALTNKLHEYIFTPIGKMIPKQFSSPTNVSQNIWFWRKTLAE